MPDSQNNTTSDINKAFPQNVEAEQTVLAACLLSTGVFEEVSLKLKPEVFSVLRIVLFSKLCER